MGQAIPRMKSRILDQVDTDVFIVGAGPAGLAAAIAARRKGFRVTVADSRRPPIDKACGEGLGPDAIAAAAALGVVIPREAAFPVYGMRFLGEGRVAEARFRSSMALGVRRMVLHRELAEQAERVGATLLWDTPVNAIDGNEIALASGNLRARWIVGADGERSRVRTWAGLDGKFLRRARYGFRRHYRIAPWTDLIEVYWQKSFQVYVTPVGSDEVGVACASYDPHLRVETALASMPDLSRRLKDAGICSTERGALSSTRRLPAVYRGPVVLIGDAAGSVDVITGQGLGIAFQQAAALAAAMEGGDLALYQKAHRRIVRHPALNAEILLAMDRWPWLGSRTRAVFARRPEIFEEMLAQHVGQEGNWDRAATFARLSWNVLLG
jgi:flavin-dependent dehydrogenase